MTTQSPLKSRVLETKLTDWRSFQFIQPSNFKDLSPEASQKLRASILNNDFTQPFYVWQDPATGTQYCLDGFHRCKELKTLQEEGEDIPDQLPATFIHCENKQQAAKLVLIYSSIYARITEEGFSEFVETYDLDLDELQEQIDLPDIDFSPFGEEPEPEDDEFELPDEVKTDIKTGDLFQVGNHFLLCGDSRNPEHVRRLVGENQLDLIVTDPPYNVDYEGERGMKMMNDKMETEQFYNFLFDSFKAWAEVTKPGGAWYVWHADTEGLNFRMAFVDAGLKLKQCLIWVKNAPVMGRQDYQWRHEPCLYGWKGGAGHYFTLERNHGTVIDDKANYSKYTKPDLIKLVKELTQDQLWTTVIYHDKPVKNDLHPTMKPVTLLGQQIKNSSLQEEKVGDGFLGSGSTMVACQQLNRRCYGMELDPKNCQIILDRMQRLEPTITITRNGKPYKRLP